MTTHQNVVAVVPAAGIGSRMGSDQPKQYLPLAGKAVIEHTLQALLSHPSISRIVVAISPGDAYFTRLPLASDPRLTIVHGGAERADSVLNALHTLADDDWALVHDAARPCVSHADINELLLLRGQTDVAGGILATPVRDTMKRAQTDTTSGHARIAHTESRSHLWHALTPQLFRAGELRAALQHGLQQGLAITDEASAMEAAGHAVALVDANPANIKITRPADMPLAEFYLTQAQQMNSQD